MGLLSIDAIKKTVIEQIEKGNGDFSNSGYFDADIIEIVSIIKEKKISFAELNFSRNNFGDEGAAALATLKNIPKLNLSQCNITAKGLNLLLQNKDIKKLITDHNNMAQDQTFFPTVTVNKANVSPPVDLKI